MTDAFDLLGQPRAPWLDEEKLQAAYHAKTLQSHPDARPEKSADVPFAEVNAAYRILQDPKQRLQHLLSLEGHAPTASGNTIPDELVELFSSTSAVLQNAERHLQRFRLAGDALSQALVKAELLEAQTNLEEQLEKISQLYHQALAELPRLSAEWSRALTAGVEKLSAIYFQLTYLTRWKSQLEEKLFQFSML